MPRGSEEELETARLEIARAGGNIVEAILSTLTRNLYDVAKVLWHMHLAVSAVERSARMMVAEAMAREQGISADKAMELLTEAGIFE